MTPQDSIPPDFVLMFCEMQLSLKDIDIYPRPLKTWNKPLLPGVCSDEGE